jgi:hypothetical protein
MSRILSMTNPVRASSASNEDRVVSYLPIFPYYTVTVRVSCLLEVPRERYFILQRTFNDSLVDELIHGLKKVTV